MGRIFLEHIGGSQVFSCIMCDAFLTNKDELISTKFRGDTGRAYLFNKVVNVRYGDLENRMLESGRHKVRDVTCKNCDTKLGWIYEFAVEESERYKEGKVILERCWVIEAPGLDFEI